jgi:mitochondrial transcription factor 1
MTRLEPSLQKHIGCDIIEVNPGIGLWSERLHNFLRPRTHILLEPDNCMYQPILQPLLDAPGSTYQLIPKSGLVWGHLEKVFTKEYLPHQEPLSRGDPRLEERNDTLLFVANLGRYPRKGYRGFSSIANLVLYQLMSAVRNHSLFQRYGHVRMLIWIANDERDTLLPQTVSLRRKSAIEAEISCEKIQEIASSAGSGEIFPREPALEFERTRLVYEKMKQAGITIPIGRESSILKEIMTGKVRGEQDEFTPKFAEELEELEARYANGELGDWGEEFHDAAFRGLQRMPRKGESPQLNRLKTLRYHFKSRKQKFDKLHDLKCEYNGVFAMQQEVYKTRDPKERQALEEVLKKRTDDWQKGANNITPSERETLFAQLDNIRIFETDPPTLMWDRRDFEPLKVHPAEFRPQREMCLLDIQPKPLWPILQEDFPVNFDVLEFIITQLFIIPTQSIRRGLSALAPGAYDYLIAECPSLTDPTKGGSLDVDQMSVRRLTQDMLKEITEAWVRWPFKPTRFEIMSQLGSTIYDPDALETDMTED